MDPLPPIPTPPAQRWREFRIQVLPLIVFVVVLLAVVMMWRNFVQPSGIVGEVEVVRANVISLQDGLVTDLVISRFQEVKKDQDLGHVANAEPELINASLAAIRTDLNVLRARMQADARRTEQNYQQLKIDILSEVVSRQIASNNMVLASNQMSLTRDLFTNKVASPLEYDVAKANYEKFKAEMEDRTRFIQTMEETILQLQAPPQNSADPIDEAIAAKERELQLTLRPTVLRAPIEGVATMIFRQPGEKVVKGEPIVLISAPHSERIVGYVRQPIGTVPAVNDRVTVRTRTQKRQMGTGQILKVGGSLEPINPALLSPDATRTEVGLPILISLPTGMKVVPGEFVDLSIEYSKR
jgi:multidrug resistance efflux pump